ncbi:MAG: histidine phosphatase family protein [Alphaproteobacteria bacterium]|nr:histidine phosphatase family protein [Alphaproteobacteria bacterium]
MRFDATELILIRHAPADTGGRLCGRRDVPLLDPDAPALLRLAERLSAVRRIVASPALRCRQTVAGLFPGRGAPPLDPRLWEQDFGAEDGRPHADVPDLGPLTTAELATRRPPGGESFANMVARVVPALEEVAAQGDGPVAIVAHAGTVRAGLARAMGAVPQALAFEIAPLSVTRLRCHPAGWSVVSVNLAG